MPCRTEGVRREDVNFDVCALPEGTGFDDDRSHAGRAGYAVRAENKGM